MHSLWFKLMVVFALVIAAAFGVVIVFTRAVTAQQFNLYVTRQGQQWAAQLAPTFADYYARTGSWQGVEQLSTLPTGDWRTEMMSGMMGATDGSASSAAPGPWVAAMMMNEGMLAEMGSRLILADAQGTVIADTEASLLGTRLGAEELRRGTAIRVNGHKVGTLFVAPASLTTSPAADFLQSINRSLVWASGVAGGLALLLGSALYLQITRPLHHLSTAAQGIAAGDLSRRVTVAADDEIGRVARAFNQMAEALQRYERERRNTLADIAHELRTPLAVVQGNLEAMLDGVLPANPEELASLHQETQLLNRLIGDLRTLSLAEAGQLRLEKRAIDLGEIAMQVVESLEQLAGEKSITLETKLADRLPKVLADPERLAQIITNLVGNALRYTPAGGRVVVATRRVAERLELAVSDNGPGIAAEDLPRIFDRFWRAERSRNRASGGSGLGLAIVKQLTEAHGGTVLAESQIGVGTTFRVHFRLLQ
ncbi:MAG: sensor histidine kinase [Anaerolineales bacterium]